MWIRWIMMPWWSRWLLTSTVLLVFYGGITLAQVLEYPGQPPAWVAPTVIGACLISGALGAMNQRARMAPSKAVLSGLTADQRGELATAIKPGPLPTDPVILAAALRIKNLARAERKRQPLWLAWAVIAAANLYAAWLASMPGSAVVGFALSIVAALYAVLLLWGQVRRRRAHPRWIALAAAVDADAAAAAIVAAAPDVPVKRHFRQWVCLVAAAAVIGAAYGATNMAIRSAQIRECRLAANVVNYVAENKELLDSDRLVAKPPPRSAYQQWAQQLADYATQGKSSSFGPDLVRIGDVADRITRTVDLAQDSSLRPIQLTSEQIDLFNRLVRQLIDAEQPLVRACR
jgi:hypothetical protein